MVERCFDEEEIDGNLRMNRGRRRGLGLGLNLEYQGSDTMIKSKLLKLKS